MLEIAVVAKNEHRITPNIGGNLELPESEQFAIIIAKKHRMILQSEAIGSDGKFDFAKYTKACVVRIDNAPMLNFGDKKRALTIDDIFTLPELESVATECFSKVTELQSGEHDQKN